MSFKLRQRLCTLLASASLASSACLSIAAEPSHVKQPVIRNLPAFPAHTSLPNAKAISPAPAFGAPSSGGNANTNVQIQSGTGTGPLAPEATTDNRLAQAQFQPLPGSTDTIQESPSLFEGIFAAGPTSRFYARTDFLLWWLKGAPLSVPLVSTGPIATTHHGFLTGPDATILYGARLSPATGGHDRQDFPLFKGGRATLGMWLDDQQQFGIEVSGMMLQRREAGYEIRSDSNGYPIITIPVFNTIAYAPGGVTDTATAFPEGEDGLPASLPSDQLRLRADGTITGGVKIVNRIQLWGLDGVGSFNFYRDSSWEFSGLAGLRYLDLSEKFDLHWDSAGQSGAYVGQSGTVEETFQTRNQFYGVIFGMRGRYSTGALSVDLMARMATGASHEVLNVWGGFTALGFPPPSSTGPEGIFAQPSNQGRRSANKFAVVPELQFKVAYAITPRLRLSLGYDYLYYSSVLRPTDQISRDLPKGQTFRQGNVDSTTQSPRQLFVPSDFFAHGMTFGLDFRY